MVTIWNNAVGKLQFKIPRHNLINNALFYFAEFRMYVPLGATLNCISIMIINFSTFAGKLQYFVSNSQTVSISICRMQ